MNKIRVGSDCSGVGAFLQAIMRLDMDYEEAFSCDFDYFARLTYLHNYGTAEDVELGNSPKHKKYADGVKKIALSEKEPTKKETEFLLEANEFSKKFSFYYPFNMYEREIPEEPLDVYCGSFPCQSFSLAGKRKGETDKRGILFYCGHEFILKNRPRYFIIENVKGLLSDDGGKTFNRWLDYLGGKSVNGNPVIFPMDEAAPYHIYWKVLNAKDFGVPQNRERVFIVGIRDDQDNNFNWPKPFPLKKRLKDVLEENVDEKYYLSDKMINYLTTRKDNFNNGKINYKHENDIATTITKSSSSLDISDNIICVGNTNPSGNGMNGNVFDEKGISPSLTTNKGEGIKIKSATKSGYEMATENDSINLERPDSETRRGRVGKGVAQTLDTGCQQGVMVIKHQRTEGAKAKRKESLAKGKDTGTFADREMIAVDQEFSDTILANPNPQKEGLILDVKIAAIRGRNPENPSDRTTGAPTEQRLEINENGTSNTLTSVQKDNVVVMKKNYIQWDTSGKGYDSQQDRAYYEDGHMGTIPAGRTENKCQVLLNNHRIRRLTVRECARLMDFPDSFEFPVSDSQGYRQMGNSIVVGVLSALIKKLNL